MSAAALLAPRPAIDVPPDPGAVEWCARVRPSIWLQAAGLADRAEQLTRASGDDVWGLLGAAAPEAQAAKTVAWQSVAAAAHQIGTDDATVRWWLLADATWPEAVALARHRLADVAAGAGVDAMAAIRRTTQRGGDPHPPAAPPALWDLAWDVPADCACAAAWRAVAAVAGRRLWSGSVHDAWWAAIETIRAQLGPTLAVLDASLPPAPQPHRRGAGPR